MDALKLGNLSVRIIRAYACSKKQYEEEGKLFNFSMELLDSDGSRSICLNALSVVQDDGQEYVTSMSRQTHKGYINSIAFFPGAHKCPKMLERQRSFFKNLISMVRYKVEEYTQDKYDD